MHLALEHTIKQRRRIYFYLNGFPKKVHTPTKPDYERIFHVKPVILNDPKNSKLNKIA